jgi:rfaE bifunctional protein nucleotidyltransferase chain/domain
MARNPKKLRCSAVVPLELQGRISLSAFPAPRGLSQGYPNHAIRDMVCPKPDTARENGMIFHLEETGRWQPILDAWRKAKETIVTTNGAFDILHVGHMHLLQEAKACGSKLVVGLNSDRSVKTYKSADRPIVPQDERARMLMAIRYVDMVLLFDEPDNLRFVDAVRPAVHVKDATYGMNLIEGPTVRLHGGEIHLVEKDEHSTTNIIEKILHVYGK